MRVSDGLTLRTRALEALERSTKMLDVAIRLLKQGNRVESDRVKNEARTQRTLSTLLMAEANKLDLSSQAFHYSGNIRSAGRPPASRP
ncbi:MAG TPA: hypothetical protein VEW46_14670 [Pyrinomonadaceae bacterium]|nr:hypothetical protein [Pyrinomonadaceae bacterium]